MIFLGAGASQPFNIPMSDGFTDTLVAKLNEEHPKLIKDIETFLNQYEEPFEFENILMILYVLTDSMAIPRTHRFQNFRIGYGHAGNYNNIIEDMHKVIYKECTDKFESGLMDYLPDKFLYTYDLLFGTSLLSKKGQIVFSTNYDPTIEIWCQRRNLECFDGSIKTKNPEVKNMLVGTKLVEHFKSSNMGDVTTQNIADVIPLVRMHGTVLGYEIANGKYIKFDKIKEELYHKDLYRSFSNKKPLLIFPGQEHTVMRDIWDYQYQFYKENLKQACLFIGYSFRHDVINDPIIDYLDSGIIEKLGVFCPNPDKNIDNLFGDREIPEKKIVRIKGKFGTVDGMTEYLKEWGRHNINTNIGEISQAMRFVNNWVKQRMSIYE